jgi:hypothetical protein
MTCIRDVWDPTPPTYRLEIDNGTEFNNELVRNFSLTKLEF